MQVAFRLGLNSSLNWLVLGFLYAIFVLGDISDVAKFLPYPSPLSLFKRSNYSFIFSNTYFDVTERVKGLTQNVVAQKTFLRKESDENLLPRQRKCYFYSWLYDFWLTLTSSIESSRFSKYVRVYKKQHFGVAIKSIETTRTSRVECNLSNGFSQMCQNLDFKC